jgi:uncharacterized membrane protein
MTNSEALSKKLFQIPNWLPFVFLFVSALGFADATYLTVKHFLGTPVPCSILHGCEVVLNSKYSIIYGIPTAMLGALFYLTVMILTAVYLETKKLTVLKLIAFAIALGFLGSLGFVYIQLFILKSICLYCMGSAVTSTTLFIFSLVFWHKSKSLDSEITPTQIN